MSTPDLASGPLPSDQILQGTRSAPSQKAKTVYRMVRSSVLGGAIGMVCLLIVLIGSGSLTADRTGQISAASILTLLLGVAAGCGVEYFLIRVDGVRQKIDLALRRLDSAQREIHAETVELCRFLLLNTDQLHDIDPEDRVQRWALFELRGHVNHVPVDTRERYCKYLRDALKIAGSRPWLGIHQGGLDFFFDEKYKTLRDSYLSELTAHTGPKYRIIVQSKKNRQDFRDPDRLKNYLQHANETGVKSYFIWRHEFERLVGAHAQTRLGDWALYGEQVIIAFDDQRKVVKFHFNKDTTRGLRTLLREIENPADFDVVNLELIDDTFIRRISPTQREPIDPARVSALSSPPRAD